jgi:uncharacterized protein YndB with AHSA1/START domain
MNKTKIIVEPGKLDYTITRTFDATPEQIFKAATDPDLIPQWWGPSTLTTTIARLDARSGGGWRFIQRDSEGNEFGFHGVYHELTRPSRIVETFEFEGMPGHVSLNTSTLEEVEGRTLLTIHSVFQSLADRDGMLESGMEGGMTESHDRLQQLLSKTILSPKAKEKA